MKVFRESYVDLPKCVLDDSNYTHIYLTPDGRKLRSVTTMISKTKPERDKNQLKRWRGDQGDAVADYIMTTAAKIGRETHKLNENYIKMTDDKSNYLLLSQAHHRKFIPYLNKISNIFGVESRLFSYNMELAGTSDCICEYEGKLSIIDYKTKRSKQRSEWMADYFLQTTAYAQMWEEMTGQRVEQLVILVSSEQDSFQEFKSEPSKYLEALKERVKLFV